MNDDFTPPIGKLLCRPVFLPQYRRHVLIRTAISSYDFPRVSGKKKNPNKAVSKQLPLKMNIHVESPTAFSKKGNRYPLTNIKTHNNDTTIASETSRI